MTWTKENMFEPSGCLTRDAFEALVNHQLPAEAKAWADEHIALCPFCADALEGFSAQKTDFAVLMDKADTGYAEMVAKTQSKASNRRALWISISAAASLLMVIGLFLFLNQPPTKMQVAQSTPKEENQDKPQPESSATTETSTKEKEVIPETKTIPQKATSRFTPPEVNSNEQAPATDKLLAEPKAGAPATAQDTYEDKAVVSDVVVEDKKEAETYKKEANKSAASGMARSKRVTQSPTVRETSADVAEMTLTSQGETPFTFVEQMPEFPGGTDAMMKFLSTNLHYPDSALEMGFSGRIVLQFVVGKDGKISNIKVLRELNGAYAKEAIRVIKSMPNWIPGKQNGKPVPVLFTLPIEVHLKE